MTRKQKRLSILAGGMGFLAVAAGLVMMALSSDITFFRTPSQLVAERPDPAMRIRLGGLVEPGTIVRGQGTKVSFDVTDRKNKVKVVYTGILPDLFRAGQGVVAEGSFAGGGSTFVADTVLAKHDEKYMPKEVADALKAKGEWYGDTADEKTARK
ncbi:cytochrome c maturation protein CcmE [Pararhizobium mangrovi]|uniref:Cytochrome c-type biogenesis protein CcmE n=1 Tax=Pararhizobium mangrovi TaxID=2590452 RepID=A0A506UHI6_9HYPH|nr:cytochrome c maturation protein CcmE [Pararhizobium mangrovi]TPW32773.1 cytochrome c maturation protein CcmE [Pararhizobium mangrovi]